MQFPVCYFESLFLKLLSLTSNHSPQRTIRSLTFATGGLPEFPLRDLQRLKDKTAWLSDNHIDFALRCVLFSPYYSSSIWIEQGLFPPIFGSRTSPRPECTSFAMRLLDQPFSASGQIYCQISIKDRAIGIRFYRHAHVWEVTALVNRSWNTMRNCFPSATIGGLG